MPTSDPTNVDNVVNLDEERARRQAGIIKMGASLIKMIEDARKSPLGLYRLCFTDDRGDAVVIKWFHKEWIDLIMHNRCVMIEAPRGSSKTTTICVVVLWLLGHNPDLRIRILCGNDEEAAKRLSEVKQHIVENPLYKMVFPHIRLKKEDKEDSVKLKNDTLNLNLERRYRRGKESTIEARGVLSSGTGTRSDLIICDDICTYRNTLQEPALRPKVLAKVRGDWLKTLNPRDGRVICIFTPWHEEDTNGVLKRETKGRWAYKRYAHGKPGDPYHSIFPELFSRDKLREDYLDGGALEYARAYLCKALAEDVQLIRAEWLRTYNKLDMAAEAVNRSLCILSIDPTGGKPSEAGSRKDLDFMGVAVELVDQQPFNPDRPQAEHRIYIPEAYQIRLTQAEAVEHIVELHSKWLPDYIVVEAQSAEDLAGWIMTRAPYLGGLIQPMPVGNLSKRERTRSVTPWLQDPRQVVLFNKFVVESSPRPFTVQLNKPVRTEVEATRTLRHQALNFPTRHDDVLDAVVQGLRFIRYYVLPHDIEEGENHNVADVDFSVRIAEY